MTNKTKRHKKAMGGEASNPQERLMEMTKSLNDPNYLAPTNLPDVDEDTIEYAKELKEREIDPLFEGENADEICGLIVESYLSYMEPNPDPYRENYLDMLFRVMIVKINKLMDKNKVYFRQKLVAAVFKRLGELMMDGFTNEFDEDCKHIYDEIFTLIYGEMDGEENANTNVNVDGTSIQSSIDTEDIVLDLGESDNKENKIETDGGLSHLHGGDKNKEKIQYPLNYVKLMGRSVGEQSIETFVHNEILNLSSSAFEDKTVMKLGEIKNIDSLTMSQIVNSLTLLYKHVFEHNVLHFIKEYKYIPCLVLLYSLLKYDSDACEFVKKNKPAIQSKYDTGHIKLRQIVDNIVAFVNNNDIGTLSEEPEEEDILVEIVIEDEEEEKEGEVEDEQEEGEEGEVEDEQEEGEEGEVGEEGEEIKDGGNTIYGGDQQFNPANLGSISNGMAPKLMSLMSNETNKQDKDGPYIPPRKYYITWIANMIMESFAEGIYKLLKRTGENKSIMPNLINMILNRTDFNMNIKDNDKDFIARKYDVLIGSITTRILGMFHDETRLAMFYGEIYKKQNMEMFINTTETFMEKYLPKKPKEGETQENPQKPHIPILRLNNINTSIWATRTTGAQPEPIKKWVKSIVDANDEKNMKFPENEVSVDKNPPKKREVNYTHAEVVFGTKTTIANHLISHLYFKRGSPIGTYFFGMLGGVMNSYLWPKVRDLFTSAIKDRSCLDEISAKMVCTIKQFSFDIRKGGGGEKDLCGASPEVVAETNTNIQNTGQGMGDGDGDGNSLNMEEIKLKGAEVNDIGNKLKNTNPSDLFNKATDFANNLPMANNLMSGLSDTLNKSNLSSINPYGMGGPSIEKSPLGMVGDIVGKNNKNNIDMKKLVKKDGLLRSMSAKFGGNGSIAMPQNILHYLFQSEKITEYMKDIFMVHSDTITVYAKSDNANINKTEFNNLVLFSLFNELHNRFILRDKRQSLVIENMNFRSIDGFAFYENYMDNILVFFKDVLVSSGQDAALLNKNDIKTHPFVDLYVRVYNIAEKVEIEASSSAVPQTQTQTQTQTTPPTTTTTTILQPNPLISNTGGNLKTRKTVKTKPNRNLPKRTKKYR